MGPFAPAVLGRFLHSLNKFCRDEYAMHYEVADYWAYDFAKASGAARMQWGCVLSWWGQANAAPVAGKCGASPPTPPWC